VEHVGDRLIEMTERRSPAGGGHLPHLHVDEVAAAIQMDERALRSDAWPRRELEPEEGDPEAGDDRHALAPCPAALRIEEEPILRPGAHLRRSPHSIEWYYHSSATF